MKVLRFFLFRFCFLSLLLFRSFLAGAMDQEVNDEVVLARANSLLILGKQLIDSPEQAEYEKGKLYLEHASLQEENGIAQAWSCVQLALLFFMGRRTERNVEKALFYIEKALKVSEGLKDHAEITALKELFLNDRISVFFQRREKKELPGSYQPHINEMLSVFVQKGYLVAAELLILLGANVNAQICGSTYCLHFAVDNELKDMVEMLVQRGADINAVSYLGNNRYEVDFTPLDRALIKRNEEIALFLIRKGALCQKEYNRGISPLYYAAQWGNEKVFKELLNNGARVNTRGPKGITILQTLALRSNNKLIRMVIAHEADIKALDEDLQSSLALSALRGSASTVKLLLELGADRGLHERMQSNTLHCAVMGGVVAVVELLIARGANIFERDTFDNTLLHCAAQFGHMHLIDLLIEKGLSLSDVNKNGETVLHAAARNNNSAMIEYLINLGADCQRIDRSGNSFEDIFQSYSNPSDCTLM